MKFPRVTKKNKCPICHSPDWCGISPDGNIAICMRVASDKTAANGGFIHRLNEGDEKTAPRPKPLPKLPEVQAVQRSSSDLNEIYTEFLSHLVLAKNHEADLKQRGLELSDIFLHGYKSMPATAFSSAICKRMAAFDDLHNVPGFYRKGGNWHFIDYRNATGFLIPIRNANYEIVGLQLRRDDDQKPKYLMMSSAWHKDGASSGAPPHYAILGIPGLRTSFDSIIVTEGALKANIIAKFANIPTVGIVGVGCFDEGFPHQLVKAFPNLKECQIAFDMDAATNKAVKIQRTRLRLTLEKMNLKVSILSWNRSFKGLDDYLSAKNNFRLAA